jgi:hypothetical protein
MTGVRSVIPVRIEPAGPMSDAPSAAVRRADAERQLSAALDRHHEAVVSMQTLGRPAAGQHVAVKSVARAVHLVAYALKRAADAHVPLERLAELTGWEPDIVRRGIEKASEPAYVARLTPPGVDVRAVAAAADALDAIERLQDLTRRILADVEAVAAAASTPAQADAAKLHARVKQPGARGATN